MITDGFAVDPLQVKAEPISQAGGTFTKTYLRKRRKHQLERGGNKKNQKQQREH